MPLATIFVEIVYANGFKMPQISLNNSQFYYELHGNGQPLVLIAGYSCDHTFWNAMLDDLSKQFQVLIFDNRGIGQTTCPDSNISLEQMAEDTISLIRALELKNPHVLGQSMGGAIAQCLARKYAKDINKLCLLNTVAKFSTIALLVLENAIRMQKENVAFETIIDTCMPWFYSSQFLSDKQNPQNVKSAILNNPYPQSIAFAQRHLNALHAFDSQAWLSEITSPTMVISSSDDLICLAADSSVLVKNIKGAIGATIHSGHSSPVESPLEINKALLSFLQS